MYKIVFLLSAIILAASCSDSSPSNETEVMDQIIDTLNVEITDTIPAIDSIVPIEILTEQMVLTDIAGNASLAHYIEYLDEKMESVQSPIRAIYEGTDFGDYFHISFRTENDIYLDFGDGNNDFGNYELYDELSFEDNVKLVGKTFEVYWEFKPSTFLCCEGGMEAVTAEVPSITNLVLIEK